MLNNKIMSEAAVQAAESRVQMAADIREIKQQHADDMRKMLSRIRAVQQQLNTLQDKQEAKASRLKLAMHVGLIAAGGVLAAIEAKMNVPGLVAIASSMGPTAVQELIDYRKRL